MRLNPRLACALTFGSALITQSLWAAPVVIDGNTLTPVGATATSELAVPGSDFRLAVHAIDNSGLTVVGPVATHTNDTANETWNSTGEYQSPTDGAPAITFDLGDAYNVTALNIWNFNETAYLFLGVKDVKILAGLTLGTLADQGDTVFPIGDGTDAYAGEAIPFAIPNVRYVRFEILSNHNNVTFPATLGSPNGSVEELVGLSEVKFQVAPVPEPASLALLSLGGLAMLRRRKA